jgi:hypothetical protein
MAHIRPLTAWSAVLILLCGICLLIPSGARAQMAETFTVHNVQADVRADNISVARDRALLEGQRTAYQALLQRLTAPADWPRLPTISDDDLQNIVLDVGIDQEKHSAVRYLATLSVRFKPDAVRRLLRSANIPYAEWRGRPVVVLPVYQTDNGAVLGENPNPWRDAWKSGAAQGVVPLVVPNADQLEGVVTGAQAAAGGPDLLAAVSQRFNTQDVVIAMAAAQRAEGGKVTLDVALSGSGPVGGPLAGQRSYAGEPGETPDALMKRAVEDIAKSANDSWKAGNLLQFDRSASLAVLVPLNSMEDWLSLREKLTRSTPVRAYEVTALSKTEAALVLHFVGDQQQLETIFTQNGLALSWAADHWVLQNASARPPAGPR